MGRREEIQAKVVAKIAIFKVGDRIDFLVPGSNEYDAVELTGTIVAIDGAHATVEHQYGTCRAWLTISKHHDTGDSNANG